MRVEWMVCLWSVGWAAEFEVLYRGHDVRPKTVREVKMIRHAAVSLERALRFESKLSEGGFREDAEVKILPLDAPSDHLLNNLCNWPGASHLHVGLLKGGSFIAALAGNQGVLREQIGVDWCEEVAQEVLERNCRRYLEEGSYRIVNCDCFQLDRALFHAPVDVYFYDADHSLRAHERAFTGFDDLFADVFIAVVDDWDCAWIRKPTFRAFDKLGYSILFQGVIPASARNGNGQYVAVIRRRL